VEAEHHQNLQEKLHLQDREEITSSPLILGRSFLKTVGAIDVSKWEIKFDIDGVRSVFKSTLIRGM
jgi:hypothetical protein